jgi:hypothetical protein
VAHALQPTDRAGSAPYMQAAAGGSYRQVLGSTLVMGGSAVVGALLGIVRTKALALLIGPTGVGLTGLYTSTITLVTAIFEIGVGESGVRYGAPWHPGLRRHPAMAGHGRVPAGPQLADGLR